MANIVKSVQSGIVTLVTSSSAGTASITAVDPTKSLLFLNGFYSDNPSVAAPQRSVGVMTLASSVAVSLTRVSTAVNGLSGYFTVVEFNSGVNSIQYGNITVASGTTGGSTTIANVGANAFVMYLGDQLSAAVNSFGDAFSGLTLASTVVSAVAGSTGAITRNVSFVVADLDSTIVQSVQAIATTFSGASTADTVNLATTVDATRSFLAFGGMYNGGTGSGITNTMFAPTLATGTVTWNRTGTASISRTHYGTVVQLTAGAGTVSRGNIAMGGTSVASASSFAAVSSLSAVNYCHYQSAASSINACSVGLALNSSRDTVTATAAAPSSSTAAYEVVTFINSAAASGVYRRYNYSGGFSPSAGGFDG